MHDTKETSVTKAWSKSGEKGNILQLLLYYAEIIMQKITEERPMAVTC